MSAKVMAVIYSDDEVRGKGVPRDPIRRIQNFYTLDGELLVSHDPLSEIRDRENGES